MKIPLVDLKANYLSIKSEIDAAIQDVLTSSSFIMGPFVKQFEENFARFCQVKHAIGCANGTAALHLGLLAAGLQKGDEVITVPNTFIATTECISYVGGVIKFVDVVPETALIDIDQLEQSITRKTKALIVVDLYGQMPDMQRLRKLADSHGLFLIEDAAQAHAAEWNDHQPGYYGDVACFSFFPAKNLGAYGDAGAVVTKNDDLAEKLHLLVNHGRTTKYEHHIEGYNYRLDALQAAILDVKLRHLAKWTDLRRQHARFYDASLPSYVQRIVEAKEAKHVYYMYEIRVQSRDRLLVYLKEKGIECGIHYPIPLHLQPAYRSLGFGRGQFPVAEQLAGEILSIPMYPELTAEQQQYVVDAIQEFFLRKEKSS
jgi:dTDP-4-amino-4,6-dideoxygalactose transaminase